MSIKRGQKLLTGVVLAMAVLLVGVSVVKVRAQGEIQMKLNNDEVVGDIQGAKSEGKEVAEAEVESSYYLPYPGILPDHPLYFFKMIRDRIVEWLTLSPESKADLFVYYADKRFGAGMALVEGNKIDLGISSYLKAVRYQGRAIEILNKLKSEGKDVGGVSNKIEQESTKFSQVIASQEAKNEQFRNAAAAVKEVLNKNIEAVLKLLGR